MSQLLQAFDSYHDFSRDAYFTLLFDALSSTLFLEVPLTATKENMNAVLEVLNLPSKQYELVVKKWNTEDAKDADFGKDFPYQLLFKNNQKKSLVWIALEHDTLTVDLYYDCKDSATEKWAIAQNDQLRKQFGLSRSPTFNVLTKCHGNFMTEEVRTEARSIDVDVHYNNDFKAVYHNIENAIKTNNSGLILLYGEPGTGKTTYIKSLIAQHQDANFIFIQNEFVNNLLDPDFISFLLKQRNAILIIEDAEKVITSRERLREDSVVSTILQLTDGLFSDYLNIKIICTFNTSLSKIDTALLRKGRMLAMYEFQPLSLQKTNQLLQSIGIGQTHEALTVADIFNYEQETYVNVEQQQIGF